jgi:hypothetical protein
VVAFDYNINTMPQRQNSFGATLNRTENALKQKPAAHLVEKIFFENIDHLLYLFGEHDKHLKLL